MYMDIRRFKTGKIYKGINNDGTVFVFSVTSKNSFGGSSSMTVKVELDRDTTSKGYSKGYTCVILDYSHVSDCFRLAEEIDESALLALII